ncbi:MAG: hypothetical protein ACYDCC_00420 [Actinomycetota bacterium]
MRFVLIGGLAANVLGSPSLTFDIDVCYARDEENLHRLAEALEGLAARLRGAPTGLPLIIDAHTLRNGLNFTFQTVAGALDCLGEPAGTKGFEELERSARKFELMGVVVLVASLDDLIRMKEAAGRPKDRIELEILGALREEVDKSRDD